MADTEIIVDIKVKTKEIKLAEDRIDDLTDSIEELSKGIADARKNNKSLKETLKSLDKQLSEGEVSTESHRKQTKLFNDEIKKNNIQIAKSTIELSKQKRERSANIKLIISEKGAYDRLNARLAILRKTAKNLGAQFGVNSTQFKKAATEVGKLDSKLKLIDNELGQNQRSVGKYSNALKRLGSQLLGALGITAGVTLLVDQFKKAAQRIGILNTLTRQLKGTFDITTKEAKKLAAQINAMAQNFEDVDTKQLQISLNAVVKTFGDISEQDALDLIQEGFQKGSNNSGEFLDILREYPSFFKKAGVSADEMFAIINQQVKAGVYSDKGVDAIKEGTNQLIENTKIVKAALKPLGESVNLQIRQKVEAGKAFEAMQLISKEMIKLGSNSSEAQTILADVFKGAGEDSGVFVENLHNVNLSMEDVEEQTSRVSEANLRLSRTYNGFLLSVSDGSGVISNAIADLTDMVSALFETAKTFNETNLQNKFKILANSVLALFNRFVPLVDLFNTLTGSNFKLQFEIKNTSDAVDENTESVDENTESVDENVTAQETAAEKTKRLAKEKRKLAEQEKKAAKQKAADAKQAVEDAKRIEAAENKLLKLDNERRLSSIENAKKLRDERIAIETETLIKSLKNEKLFAIEKEALIAQSTANIVKINKEFNDQQGKDDEEILNRKQTANETIREFEEAAQLVKIKDLEQLKNKIIEFEEAKTILILENDKLLDVEKRAIKLESEQKIKEIEQAFADEKEENEEKRLEKRKELLEGFFSDMIQITGQFAGEEIAVFGKIGAGIAKAFEDGKITAENAFDGMRIASNAVFDNLSQRRAQDLSENEAAKQKELELAEGDAIAQDNINIFYDTKAAALKLKQFKADKAKTLIEIAIATSLAVIRAAAALPIPPYLLAIAVGALGATQLGIVAAKKPPKFAGGVNDIVNIGDSHSSGKDTDVWGFSGNQKQYFGKVEKGEAMPVIRKSAVNDYMVSKLNGRFSGKSRTFQDGTSDITQENQTQNNEVFVSNLVDAFSNIKIVAKIEDITKEAGKKIEIVDNSKV